MKKKQNYAKFAFFNDVTINDTAAEVCGAMCRFNGVIEEGVTALERKLHAISNVLETLQFGSEKSRVLIGSTMMIADTYMQGVIMSFSTS